MFALIGVFSKLVKADLFQSQFFNFRCSMGYVRYYKKIGLIGSAFLALVPCGNTFDVILRLDF